MSVEVHPAGTQDQETPARIADYRIVEPWPTEDQSDIYLANPPARLGRGDRRVVVKVARGVSDEERLELAIGELRRFAAVTSPYLVSLVDAGQDDDVVFYAIDWPSLGTLQRPVRTLSLAEQLQSVSRAARGADALHEAGILHCGIAPSRILLHETGARLADLSVAWVVPSGPGIGNLPGVDVIEYVDPTLLFGGTPSRASDIWSLGSVLHFAAADGKSLYPKLPTASPLGRVHGVLSQTPMIAPELSSDLTDLIRWAIEEDPADRPVTAAELADRIDSLAGTRP